MLDVSLRGVTRGILREVTVGFPKSAHTAIVGPPGAGASTLLGLIAGSVRAEAGAIEIGARDVTKLRASRRPLLAVNAALDVPDRWSVQHALVAAVRQRTLDRHDRHHEYGLAVDKWELGALLERRIGTLSSTERVQVQLARIELLRPAVLVADRLLLDANPSARHRLADTFYRTLRVFGTTVISAPASRIELAMTDRVVVLERGRIVQIGGAAEIYAEPANEAAAIATGEINIIPVEIHGTTVESAIGSWELTEPPFEGNGIALARPDDFVMAKRGEESDFVFNLEEAGFSDGRWRARGVLSGGTVLRITLPGDAAVHKGKLIALRYEPARFRLLPRDGESPRTGIPTDVIPPLHESR